MVGGIERALTVLANYFDTKGHEVVFISCLTGENFYTLNSNVKLVEPCFKNTGGIKKIFFYIKLLFFLRREIKSASPDVVLSFGDWFNPIVLFSLLGLKFPVYISDRTSPDYKFNIITSIGKKYLYPKSAGFIAQTRRAADFKMKQFGNKLNIKIIPNAIREVIVNESKKENIILFVGRFSWEKAPERIIQAFSQIERKKDWKLHMAGEGYLLKDLKKQVVNLGLEDKVVFHGSVSNIDELYSKASIYVLPSKVEGFPNALCEAMAFSLPCICFDCIPYEDIITNGENGIVISNNDISMFADKLQELIDYDKLRLGLGEKAKTVADKLTVSIVGDLFLDFIIP